MKDVGATLRAARPIVIVGAGDHGRVVLDLARTLGHDVLGFVEPTPGADRTSVEGVAVIGDLETPDAWRRGNPAFVAALGDNKARAAAFERCHGLGLEPVALVHPTAILLGGASVAAGAVVCAGAVVGVMARVGENAVVNTSASLDHDVILGAHVQIGPGAHLAGRVMVGDGAFIGIGAAVREGIRIGSWALVAGGAMVVGDVPDGGRAAGVPARPMAPHPPMTAGGRP